MKKQPKTEVIDVTQVAVDYVKETLLSILPRENV